MLGEYANKAKKDNEMFGDMKQASGLVDNYRINASKADAFQFVSVFIKATLQWLLGPFTFRLSLSLYRCPLLHNHKTSPDAHASG